MKVDLVTPHPSADDWVGVFSPSKFKYAIHFFMIRVILYDGNHMICNRFLETFLAARPHALVLTDLAQAL